LLPRIKLSDKYCVEVPLYLTIVLATLGTMTPEVDTLSCSDKIPVTVTPLVIFTPEPEIARLL
jgi:hypothetical protein